MCRGQPCDIISYSFTWDNKSIKAASGQMPDPNNPGRTIVEDVLAALLDQMLLTTDPGFVLKRVRAKAERQAKDGLGRRLVADPASDTVTLLDAACGDNGKCRCLAIEGGKTDTLEATEMTFTIEGLAGSGLQPGMGWETFSVTLTVMATTRVTEGRCFTRELAPF